tara:strand:+ start:10385 stop:10936 length:552 start_codon:yes stop_codon:yes gene_type:complete
MKYIKVRPKTKLPDTRSKAKLIIIKGIAYFDCDINIVGMQMNTKGSGTIVNTMPDNWIVQQGSGKIIIVDTSGQGTKQAELFQVDGKLKLSNIILCDKDLNVVQNVTSSDTHQHQWNKSLESNLDTDTRTWDNMQTENITMKTSKDPDEKPKDPATYAPAEGGGAIAVGSGSIGGYADAGGGG